MSGIVAKMGVPCDHRAGSCRRLCCTLFCRVVTFVVMHRVASLRSFALFLLAFSGLLAQARAADRVVDAVDPTHRAPLPIGFPAWANPQTDAGALPADFPIQHATIILARSPDLQRAFEELLARQQEPGSADYHHWLTPVEVGERFGVSANDIIAVTQWLASENLQVESVSNSRVLIVFNGSAAAVGEAFGARMHRYMVDGEQRMSVSPEPSIPAALAPVIRAVSGLYTVKLYPMHRSGVGRLPVPADTLSGSEHFVFPADFATIYDLNSVYSIGVTGTGQTIVIIGDSRVDNADIENFQTLSGLPVQDPIVTIPPNGTDPGPPMTTQGSYTGGQMEATIDVTRASGVAPGATIDLVVSSNAGSGCGVCVATEYVVDANPVPARVMNLSWGACESTAGSGGVTYWDTFFSQAAAEGISVFVSSGDAGAAGCDNYFTTPPASQILSPNYICSSTYATCVGGTEFADTSNPSQYWSATNGANYESALGYIPEGGWNEPLNSSSSPQTSQSGGGVSAYIATPAWQSGIAPGYQGRYTPDVSFTASCHDGYFSCLAAAGEGCTSGNSQDFIYFCGTSATAPDMAGIAALINQKEGSPQGNLNPALYRLSVTAPTVFHDVTVQSSGVANCEVSVPSMCNNSTPSPTGLTGGLAGYLVGPGYDEVTGLGSIDVANLLANWASTTTPLPSTTTTLISSANTALHGTEVTLTASANSSDSVLAMGTVSFLDGTATLGTATLGASGSAAYSTTSLTAGLHSITAVYGGDATHAGSTSAALVQAIAPTGCTFGLNSTSQTFSPAGGSGVVNVTTGSGCFWAASSPAAWVTLTAPPSGDGSATLHYTVAADNGADRSVTLSVAALAFNVQQSGAPPSVQIDSPAPGSTISGTVTVTGWAIDNASFAGTAIASVKVLVDGTAVGTATYGVSRPDVCAVFPGRPGCPNVGFTYSLNTATLTVGSHTITVTATDSASPPHSGSASVTVIVGRNAVAVVPTVHIDSPAQGATISGTVTVSGWAIDNDSAVGTAISSVHVLVDGTSVGTATYGVSRPDVCAAYPGRLGCPNVGYTYSLNTATLAAGSHTIMVTATDSASPPDTGSASVTVIVASAAAVIPSVFIDSPAPGASVSGTVTVEGWAIDNASVVGTAISSVQVLVDGTAVGTANYGVSRPDVCAAFPGRPGCPDVGFTYSLNTAALTAGLHSIAITAKDSASPPDAGSAKVIFIVGSGAHVIPTVHIDSPAPGATVSGTVTVSGWAIDNDSAVGTAIGSVRVLVDGTSMGTATYGASRPDVCAAYPDRPGCPNVGYTYSLNTATLASGSHTITVTATDSASPPDTGSATITVQK